MTTITEKDAVFDRLKRLFSPYLEHLDCSEDKADAYNLNTRHLMKNKKPLYFGGVKINKSFVSYHLMAIYVFPELTEVISDDLGNRLKGKSCFNIPALNDTLVTELETLTRICFDRYQAEGYI